MNLEDLFEYLPYIIAFLSFFLFPLFFSKKKKAKKTVSDFLAHLQGIGVEVSELKAESELWKLGKKISRGNKPEGIFEVKNRSFDYIMITSNSSQYGINYYVEYLVRSSFSLRERPLQKTRMKRKKESFFTGKVTDVVWKGDPNLAQKLNMDYGLRHRLVHGGLEKFKGEIKIIPDQKHGYMRIKTGYSFPSLEIFLAIDTIAHHLKSGI